MNSNRLVLELESGTVLPVQDAAGARLACLKGNLWITQEGDGVDTVLDAGKSLRLSRNGCTLVQALSPSRVAMEAPQASDSPTALAPLRLAA